jgi:hypothetical protein
VKDETLHDEGVLLDFSKKGQKNFPTRVEKKNGFKK